MEETRDFFILHKKLGGRGMKKIKGAQIFVECLREQSVDTLFGYPGGAVLPIYDALYDAKDIRHILTAHEQNATHAADGYARATGKTGVVLVTSGPGATNTVTGIATAYMDSVPIVAFTGQVATSLIGRDSFQEVDIKGITTPITKHNFIVKDVTELAHIIREAFAIASSGRPGPVLVDIPKDVQIAEAEYIPGVFNGLSYVKAEQIDRGGFESSLVKAVALIEESERPVILAGGGVGISRASESLVEFAEHIDSPVVTTLMGLGNFPAHHRLFLGMTGMHGSRYANYALTESDLIIAVGTRFSDRVISDLEKFGVGIKIIHIDIDAAEIGKNVRPHISLLGNAKDILDELNMHVSKRTHEEWLGKIESWREAHPLKKNSSSKLSPQYIIETLSNLTEDRAIITTEVGQNQMWTAQFYKFTRPRTFITSGGLGTMGYGLGAAIGACIGNPNMQVINIAGDGSFMMNLTELATISRYNLPIIQIVFNNHSLGMVRQWQNLFFGKRYSYTSFGHEVDFVKLADAFGIEGVKVTKNEEVEGVLRYALDKRGPIILECNIHPDEMVLPIVPPGETIDVLID